MISENAINKCIWQFEEAMKTVCENMGEIKACRKCMEEMVSELKQLNEHLEKSEILEK